MRLLTLLLTLTLASTLPAQNSRPDIAGAWQGHWSRSAGDVRVLLDPHIDTNQNLLWSNLYLLDSPGIVFKLDNFRYRNGAFTYTPFERGPRNNLRLTLSPDGATLTGTFSDDDGPHPITLTRTSTPPPIPQPTSAQLHDYLLAAAQHSQLLTPDTQPFHLTADILIDPWAGRQPAGTAHLDELYRDPQHWTLTLTYASQTFTESHNGHANFTSGPRIQLPPIDDPDRGPQPYDLLTPIESALFRPIPTNLLTSTRLHLAESQLCAYATKPIDDLPDSSIRSWFFDCTRILAEPELPGVPSTTPVAVTSFDLGTSDLLPYRVGEQDYSGHDGSTLPIQRSAFAPFQNKSIPRTLSVVNRGNTGHLLRIHVTVLESATDFAALNAHAPADATRTQPRRQDLTPPTEIVHGQPLETSGSYQALHQFMCTSPHSKAKNTWLSVQLKLHVTATGQTEVTAVSDANHLLDPEGVAALKQIAPSYFRYRVSYSDNRPVADVHLAGTPPCFIP